MLPKHSSEEFRNQHQDILIISKYEYKYPRYIFLLDIVAADDFRYKFHNRYFQGFHKRASKDNELKERKKEREKMVFKDRDRQE